MHVTTKKTIRQHSSAFHEAVSDAIALSISTPKHLQTLGLVQKSVDDTAHDINYLFSLALDKVWRQLRLTIVNEIKFSSAFISGGLSSIRIGNGRLAMGYFQQEYRGRSIQLPLVATKVRNFCYLLLSSWQTKYSIEYFRERYGGIKPPVLRSEMDFDPGAKFHIPANIPYIRWVISLFAPFHYNIAICILMHLSCVAEKRHIESRAAVTRTRKTSERNDSNDWKRKGERKKNKNRTNYFQLNEQNKIFSHVMFRCGTPTYVYVFVFDFPA